MIDRTNRTDKPKKDGNNNSHVRVWEDENTLRVCITVHYTWEAAIIYNFTKATRAEHADALHKHVYLCVVCVCVCVNIELAIPTTATRPYRAETFSVSFSFVFMEGMQYAIWQLPLLRNKHTVRSVIHSQIPIYQRWKKCVYIGNKPL